MNIHRLETTAIPQTKSGREFADRFEKRLKEQNAFRERKESTQAILIMAEYWFDVKENKDE